MDNVLQNTPASRKNNARLIIAVIGILYIIGPLIHMNTLITQKDWYFSLYSHLPPWLTMARYSFSWLQRILAITAAIGLFYHKEICRKLLLALCSFTILTIYWKHPYEAFLKSNRLLDDQFGYLISGARMTFESLTPYSIVAHSILNVAFCGAVIYFLTRPQVKEVFKK